VCWAYSASLKQVKIIRYRRKSQTAERLFSRNVATLWGPSQSVLTLLSVNVIDDDYGASPSNQRFMNNMAQWLAVPEPSPFALAGLGLCALVACRKMRQQPQH